MSNTFDTDSFMNAVTTDSLDTFATPVPEGEFTAFIKDIKPRQAKNSAILDVFWIVEDDAAKAATGRTDPQVRQSIFLDLTDAGTMDWSKGKNISLGRLRDAVNQNQKGQQWSPGMLIGQTARIKVAHSMYNDMPQADVKAVVRIS